MPRTPRLWTLLLLAASGCAPRGWTARADAQRPALEKDWFEPAQYRDMERNELWECGQHGVATER